MTPPPHHPKSHNLIHLNPKKGSKVELCYNCKCGLNPIETTEAEEPDEKQEDDEDQAVPVENESYVNLRKKMAHKHKLKLDNHLKENGKLCREFQRKQVNKHVRGDKQVVGVCVVYCLCSAPRVQSSRRFTSMLEQRRKLPAWQESENILRVLEQSQVLVVTGMTGWVTSSPV